MKADIYLRTSTSEQSPEKQKAECLELLNNKGYELGEVWIEHISGWKDIKRDNYEKVKERARKGEIKAVIVWALDRWVRNRDTLIEDTVILKNYNCKIHSVRDSWLEAINIDGPLGKTIQEFLLGIVGSLAEMESQRKSARVIMAFKSHKGKAWGRPKMSPEVSQAIIEASNQGKSYSQICKEIFYWDKNNNKKFVSKAFVHKIIVDSKRENNRFEGVI